MIFEIHSQSFFVVGTIVNVGSPSPSEVEFPIVNWQWTLEGN
jgi:hypothetical protein